MTKIKNNFDATASMLGYLYQARYALLLSLQRIREVNDPDNYYVSIEKLDDIAFSEGNNPVELLQTKYHGSEGKLTDRSADIWKTIRIWSEGIKNGQLDPTKVDFTLITTQDTAEGFLVKLLPKAIRDIQSIKESLNAIVSETSNATNLPAYQAYDSLTDLQKDQLINSVRIINRSPHILDVEDQIKKELRLIINTEHVDAFLSRLEGEWFKRIIIAMTSVDSNQICLAELVSKFDELRSQFSLTNLTADYVNAEPEDIDIDNDGRVFVEQLRLLGLNNQAIRAAIINYYRAYEQRSRWSRDGLVRPGELKSYLQLLQDEWSHHSSLICSEVDNSDTEQSKKSGREIYAACQSAGAVPIRKDFNYNYVARGSYHTLADELKVGWHPNYLALLQEDKKAVA